MPKISVSLGIGFAGARQEDIIEINKEEWEACSNEQERNELMDESAIEWAWNHIDIGWSEVEE